MLMSNMLSAESVKQRIALFANNFHMEAILVRKIKKMQFLNVLSKLKTGKSAQIVLELLRRTKVVTI